MFRLMPVFGVCLVVCGCTARTDVTGKVTYEGKVVASGSVVLIAGDKLPYSAMLTSEGTFSIPQVPVGPAKIAVTSPRPSAGLRSTPPPRGAGDLPPPPPLPPEAANWFPIAERFADPETSGLTAEIAEGKPLDLNLP